MGTDQIIIIVLTVGIAIMTVAAIVAFALLYRNISQQKAVLKAKDGIIVVNGVRYSKHADVTKGGEVNVSLQQDDIILEKGKSYTAKKETSFLPGKYAALTSSKSAEKFNVRVGGIVREFTHGDTIVLGEGEQICAVSHSVILR